jgi:hypothetical protein
MKRTIIVTDLTRFSKPDMVCTAGIDPKTGECIRPMPYLSSSECKRLKILPGGRLTAEFTPSRQITKPHTEDHGYTGLAFQGPCTSDEFRAVLEKSSFNSVEEGFDTILSPEQKHLPDTHKGPRSIVTLPVLPSTVSVVEDSYKPGKIKLHFRDKSGKWFRFIPITDLGFHDYAMAHHARSDLKAVNKLISEQKEVFLRIGVSRVYKVQDGRNGYWLQANGIYTFPEFNKVIRSYSE